MNEFNSYNLATVRTRYVIPFEFDIDQGFENVCEKVDAYIDHPYDLFESENYQGVEKRWVRSSLRSKGEQDVYDFIIDEFSGTKDDDSTEKNGCFWRYYSLENDPLKNNSFELYFTEAKSTDAEKTFFGISIVDMGLYVFRSGIGFLWYEISIEPGEIENSEQLINFQNVFKELNRKHNYHLWIDTRDLEVPSIIGESEKIPFMLGNWIAERLSFLGVKYQAQRENLYAELLAYHYWKDSSKNDKKEKQAVLSRSLPAVCPDRALLFSYAVFEGREDFCIDENSVRTAYYLTNGYKQSYNMSDNIADQVRKPFSNVIWMATREGCGYYAWADSKENISFFIKGMYRKIMNDYFLLYIKVLYQSFSLMKYVVYTAELLPNDVDEYLEISDRAEELSDNISRIATEINLFLVKSIVASVSHIHHQNDFYRYLCEQFKIKEDVASVTAGLASLNEIQQETVNKKHYQAEMEERSMRDKAEEREKKADNMFQIGLGLMTFLVVISAVADSYGIMESLNGFELSQPWAGIFNGLFVFCIVMFIISGFIFAKSVSSLFEKKRSKNRHNRNDS